MTSHFDSLEALADYLRSEKLHADHHIIVINVLKKARAEILKKLGSTPQKFVFPLKVYADKNEWEDNTWLYFFQHVHSNFDHTEKWHLRLISNKTDAEIERVKKTVEG